MTKKLHIHKFTWGEHLWAYIHTLCIVYGLAKDVEQQSQKVIKILYNIPSIMPCEFCADHLRKLMKDYPPDNCLKAMELFQWSVELHNKVNQFLGKKLFSIDEALHKWTNIIIIDD